MKRMAVLLCLCLFSTAQGSNVDLKAQHNLTTSDDIYAIQATKNTSEKANMLSVVATDGAVKLSAPVLGIARSLVTLGDKMEPLANINAAATGQVSYPAQELDIQGDAGSGMNLMVFGTPDVGSGEFAAIVECCCEQSGCGDDPNHSGWAQCDTATSEGWISIPTATVDCIGETAYTPYIRARRGSIRTSPITYPF